jgi:hypothetical protein
VPKKIAQFYPADIDPINYPGIIHRGTKITRLLFGEIRAMDDERTYTTFAGERLIVSADLKTMLLRTKEFLDRSANDSVLIFEDQTGQQVDFDFRGTPDEVLERAEVVKTRTGPGRPRLGVISREVSLLPRHWEWLERQPSGISAALRRLVDEARKRAPSKERARLVREAASQFMWAMAGNLPGFEEASRALFAKDHGRFEHLISGWPEDIRKHLSRLVQESARLEGADTVPDLRSVEG